MVDNNSELLAYRHDAHKLLGKSHQSAADTFQGIPVNQTVPLGADGDAAALSRPAGDLEATVETHRTRQRLSLVTGTPVVDTADGPCHTAIKQLLADGSPAELHQRWLSSEIAATVNESPYHPYTSLKYHTLLTAALLDVYREGHTTADVRLIVDSADTHITHRTIFAGERFALRLDVPTDSGGAALGSEPARTWAHAWGQLPTHPLETDHDKHEMVLDANLRRIRSWSTALQYIEDFERVYG